MINVNIDTNTNTNHNNLTIIHIHEYTHFTHLIYQNTLLRQPEDVAGVAANDDPGGKALLAELTASSAKVLLKDRARESPEEPIRAQSRRQFRQVQPGRVDLDFGALNFARAF